MGKVVSGTQMCQYTVDLPGRSNCHVVAPRGILGRTAHSLSAFPRWVVHLGRLGKCAISKHATDVPGSAWA
jgi:hypothetical protein